MPGFIVPSPVELECKADISFSSFALMYLNASRDGLMSLPMKSAQLPVNAADR